MKVFGPSLPEFAMILAGVAILAVIVVVIIKLIR